MRDCIVLVQKDALLSKGLESGRSIRYFEVRVLDPNLISPMPEYRVR